MKSYTFHISLPGTGRTWRKIELAGNQTLHDLHYAIQNAFEWDADHLYSFFMSGRAWDQSTEYAIPESYLNATMMPFADDEEDEDEDESLEEDALPDGEDISTGMFAELLDNLQQLSDEGQALLVRMTAADLNIPADQIRDALDLFRSMENPDQLTNLLMGNMGVDESGDATTTTLDELKLRQGKTFMYLFDYGDEWRFKVKVHAVSPNASTNVKYPRLVEEVGVAPVQYPDWDEDDWDDDDEGAE